MKSRRGIAELWLLTWWDLATSAPGQIAHELSQDYAMSFGYRNRAENAAMAVLSARYLEHLIVDAKSGDSLFHSHIVSVDDRSSVWTATSGVLRINPMDAIRAE